jgi:hypothetical protein
MHPVSFCFFDAKKVRPVRSGHYLCAMILEGDVLYYDLSYSLRHDRFNVSDEADDTSTELFPDYWAYTERATKELLGGVANV